MIELLLKYPPVQKKMLENPPFIDAFYPTDANV
jgi:hypothetical protein